MRRFIKMSRFATVLLVLFMLLILRVSVDASTGFDDAEEEEKEGVQMETDESSMFSADTKVLRLSPKNFRGITDGIRHPNVKMDPETMSKAEKAKLDIMMKDAKDPSKARTNPNAIGLLVLFYTEWCGHCQELVPIFDQASKEIDYYAKAEGEGNPMTRVHLVAVDASGDEASKALHEEYGISQFPTLQWWRGGFFSDEYSGKLPVTESTELVDWVIFRMTSTTTGAEDIPTAKDGRQFIEDTNQRGETAVIGFLDEPQEFGSHFAHKSFQRFPVDVDKLRVGAAIGDHAGKVGHRLGGTDRVPYVMAFRNTDDDFYGEEAMMQYSGPFLERQLRSWLTEEVMTPRLVNFQDEFYQQKLLGPNRVADRDILGLVFTADEMPKDLAMDIVEVDRDLFPPRDYGDKEDYERTRALHFARVEYALTNEEHIGLRTFYGVAREELPSLVFINVTDIESRRWTYGTLHEGFDTADVAAYARSIIQGELEPSERGQAVPESNEGFIKIVVRDTWNELVIDQDEDDVLVLLHATFGGVSDTMLEAFYRIGKYFEEAGSEASNIRIVTCDVIQNALPDIGDEVVTPLVLHFPPRSLREKMEQEGKLNDANDTGISMYHGGADPNDILAFLDSKATVGRVPEPREASCGGDEEAVAGHMKSTVGESAASDPNIVGHSEL